MLNKQENRPLQFYLSQRSHPLSPDHDDSLLLNNSNEKYENNNKNNASNSKKHDNLLPSFPSNLEEYIKEDKTNSLKASSRNTNRILLPNPYPKKNSQRSSFTNDENENQKELQNKDNQNNLNKQNSRKNSFSIEEFKEYNKKFQGKKLSERLDIISQEYENQVIGDLKKLEEKISETKPSNLVIFKTNVSPKYKNTDFSLNDAISKNNENDDDKTKINNTNETLNERYVSIEKKEEKFSSVKNKKTFSSNRKFDQTNELEYSPFTNKLSHENSRSYLLATQSQKKEPIKIEECSEFNNSSSKSPNIQKVNEKIRKDMEQFQKKGSITKKKEFLIQTNISPCNQELVSQFRNLNVSPINNSSNFKDNSSNKKMNYSEKKEFYSNKSNKKANYSEKKDCLKDETCQANFESFDQYFVSKYDMKKEEKLNIVEEENFRSVGEALEDPSKCLKFDEKKNNSIEQQKPDNSKILENKILEIETQALSFIRSDEIQTAIDLLLANEHLIERLFKNYHPQRLYICYLLSYCFYRIQKPDVCEFYNEKAFKLLKDNECFKHEINCLYAYYILKITAISALEQKDYVNAINNFQKMLNLYELRKQLFTPKENEHNEMLYFKEFLNVYYNLSSSYLELKQNKEALFYLKEVERILIESNDTRYLLMKLKIADIYMELKNYDEALENYLELLKKLNKNPFFLNDSSEILSHLYENLALLFYDMKNYNESLIYFEKCVEISDKTFGMHNKKKASCYLFLGKISTYIKHYSQAYCYYQKSVAAFDRIEGINNFYSLNCMINMAQIKHYLKEYALSFELYEKILQTYISKLGNNHLYVYVIYLNLIYLSHLLKYDDKKDYFYSELIHTCCNNENHDTFVIFNELGNMFRNLVLYNEAIQNYSSAIKCAEKFTQTDHSFQVSLVHYNLAVCFLQINNIKDSIKHNRSCLEVNSNLLNPRNLAFKIKVLYNLGSLYSKINRINEANIYNRQAQDLETKFFNNTNMKTKNEKDLYIL